jgi:hypothetical protein
MAHRQADAATVVSGVDLERLQAGRGTGAVQVTGMPRSLTDDGSPRVDTGKDGVQADNPYAADVARLQTHFSNRPSFGGLWVDRSDDGNIVINLAFTERLQEQLAEARRMFPRPTLLRGVSARRSKFDLERVSDRLLANREVRRTEDASREVPSIWLEIRNNQVVVAASERGVAEELAETAGKDRDAIAVRILSKPKEVACWPEDCRWYMLGGLEAYDANNARCTTGFSVYLKDENGIKRPGVVTAGHCPNVLRHAGYSIGTYVFGITGMQWDFQTHRRDNTWLYVGQIMKRKADDTYWRRNVTEVQSETQDYEGQRVCHSGVASGPRCGDIVSKTFNPGHIMGRDFRLAKMIANPGDSGAPVTVTLGSNSHMAAGIVSISALDENGTSYMGYSHIGYIHPEIAEVITCSGCK